MTFIFPILCHPFWVIIQYSCSPFWETPLSLPMVFFVQKFSVSFRGGGCLWACFAETRAREICGLLGVAWRPIDQSLSAFELHSSNSVSYRSFLPRCSTYFPWTPLFDRSLITFPFLNCEKHVKGQGSAWDLLPAQPGTLAGNCAPWSSQTSGSMRSRPGFTLLCRLIRPDPSIGNPWKPLETTGNPWKPWWYLV
jgi:hypothetical protein